MVICSTYSPLASLKGKCNNEIHKMCYVQQQQVSQIWKKMMEITTQDKQRNDLKEVVSKQHWKRHRKVFPVHLSSS